MKARPSTSFRIANKSHSFNTQNSNSSSNFKFQNRQVFQNRTNENNSSGQQTGLSQPTGGKSCVDKENLSSVSGLVSKENVFAKCANNA